MMSIIVYAVILAITYLVANYCQVKYRQNKFLKHFHGPKPIPLLGNTLQMGTTPSEIFQSMNRLAYAYKNNTIMHGFLNDFSIVITNLKDVERILNSSKMTEKSLEYTFLHKWLGTGLLVSAGKKWFTRRKILTPSFHFNILEGYLDVFKRQSNTFVRNLKKYAASGEEFDIYPMTALSALDVMCEASMGVEMHAQSDPHSEYVQAVKKESLIVFHRIFSVLKLFPSVHEMSPKGREENKYVEVLHKFSNDVIKKRREKLKKLTGTNLSEHINDVSSEHFSVKKRLSLLDMLLSATVDGKPLSDEDIREEVDTFMFAGHDTTTSGIAFLLYSLSKNPDIQQKLYEEVKDLFTDGTCRINDLNSLSYFELVLKESLRMHPPVPMLARKIVEDTEFNGAIMPSGSTILIPLYAHHHNPVVYENPEKFDPERFLIDNQNERPPFCYIPFSAGNRNCIGQKFAVLEIKVTVSNILTHYKVLPCEVENEPILMGDLILRSENGVRIKLAPRNP